MTTGLHEKIQDVQHCVDRPHIEHELQYLLDMIEMTVVGSAQQYDEYVEHDLLDVDDDAIELVQVYILDIVIESGMRNDEGTASDSSNLYDGGDTPEAWFDRLLDDFEDPHGQSATTNIGIATGAMQSRTNNEYLLWLSEAAMRRKYNKIEDNS